MAEPVTADEVWSLLRENAAQLRDLERSVQELAEQSKETERSVRELTEQSKETERRFKETDERFKETDERFRELAERLKETDRLLRKTDDRLSKQIGHLGNSVGAVAEGMAAVSVLKLFAKAGLGVRYGYRRAVSVIEDRGIEIDILLLNTDRAIAVEVKNRAELSDVERHLERLREFKYFFPEHADKIVFGAIASLDIDDSIARYAYRRGLYVVVQRSDAMEILNDDRFKPRQW